MIGYDWNTQCIYIYKCILYTHIITFIYIFIWQVLDIGPKLGFVAFLWVAWGRSQSCSSGTFGEWRTDVVVEPWNWLKLYDRHRTIVRRARCYVHISSLTYKTLCMYVTYNIMTANMVMLYAYPSFVHVSFMLISGGDLPDPPRRLVRERWDRADPVDAKVGSYVSCWPW